MLSIVVPVYNEQDTLVALHDELDDVGQKHQYDLDVVYVDDGSTDRSWERICELCARDSRVRGVRFRRNFGKAAALSAGFDAACGDLVLTMDADLQDDPGEIPKLLAKLEAGADVVSGWKKVRHDPWHKVIPSRVFNWLVSWLTGVRLHDHNCGLKCYRREVFREVRLYGELHRFVPVLAAARGWRIDEVAVQHRPRSHGQSKYGWLRIPKGFLDLVTVKLLTGYGQRPHHILGMAGLVCFCTGSVGIGVLTTAWVVSRLSHLAPLFGFTQPIHLHQRAIFFYSLGAVLLGAQFMSIGFLAALVTAMQRRHTDSYSVVERAGGGALWRKVGDGGRGARGVEQDNIGDYARGEQSCAPSRSSESSPRKA